MHSFFAFLLNPRLNGMPDLCGVQIELILGEEARQRANNALPGQHFKASLHSVPEYTVRRQAH